MYDTKPTEPYGHFVFDTKTQKLKTIDEKAQDNFLIDPVAFAYDFGARMYDARLGRFLSVDPLTNKYPEQSPYNGIGNNPILYIDSDGREIHLYHITDLNSLGKGVVKSDEVSVKMQEAFVEVMKTSEGRNFFSMFAKKGQELGGYTFKEDGKYADQNLNIFDYSLEDKEGQKPASGAEGSYSIDENLQKNGVDINLKFYSYVATDAGEVIMHESRLHGYKTEEYIEAYKKFGLTELNKLNTADLNGDLDHDALNKKDISHTGYKAYSKGMKELTIVRSKNNKITKPSLYQRAKNTINNLLKKLIRLIKKAMKIKLLLIATISLALSCNEHQNTIKKIYLRKTTDSNCSKKDNYLIVKMNNAIYLGKHTHRPNGIDLYSYINKEFYLIDSCYYERNLFFDDSTRIVEYSYLLSFTHIDTSFSIRRKYYPLNKFAIKGSEDWKYTITKISTNNFLFQKTSLIDSMYTEKYYYDSLFNIYKIVENKFGNTYEYY